MRVRAFALVAAAILSWQFVGPVAEASAADKIVKYPPGPGEYGTIQAAINACSNGDVVKISDGDWSGSGNRNLNFGGKLITVRSLDGRDNCKLKPNSGYRAFLFDDNETVAGSKVIDLTFEDAVVIGGGAGDGAAIEIHSYSGVTIEDCLFLNNRAGDKGGAVYLYGTQAEAVIRNCVFDSNVADHQGGAIGVHNGAELTLYDCEFYFNYTGNDGGAIWVDDASVTLDGCTLESNSTDDASDTGGGIHIQGSSSTLSITDSVFYANWSEGLGGAINIHSGTATVISSVFEWNEALQGGAISVEAGGTLHLENSFLFANEAGYSGGAISTVGIAYLENSVINDNYALGTYYTQGGGAIYAGGGSATYIDVCTITGNDSSNRGGGLFINYVDELVVTNSILWENTQSSGGSDSEDAYILYVNTGAGDVVAHYCIMGNHAFGVTGTSHDNTLTDDPLLEEGEYGLYYLLESSSPAIDSGNNGYNYGSTDVDGLDRLVDGPDVGSTETVDRGASEYQ